MVVWRFGGSVVLCVRTEPFSCYRGGSSASCCPLACFMQHLVRACMDLCLVGERLAVLPQRRPINHRRASSNAKLMVWLGLLRVVWPTAARRAHIQAILATLLGCSSKDP